MLSIYLISLLWGVAAVTFSVYAFISISNVTDKAEMYTRQWNNYAYDLEVQARATAQAAVAVAQHTQDEPAEPATKSKKIPKFITLLKDWALNEFLTLTPEELESLDNLQKSVNINKMASIPELTFHLHNRLYQHDQICALIAYYSIKPPPSQSPTPQHIIFSPEDTHDQPRLE